MLRHLNTEGGFALLSTIVAMVLLGIAVAALSSSGIYAVAAHTDTSARSNATAIAASYMEEVKARSIKTLASEAATNVSADGVKDPSGHYIRSLEVVPEEGLPFTKRVTVTLRYPTGRGRTGKVELVTVIYVGDQG